MSGVNLTVRDLHHAMDYAGRLRDHARALSHTGEYVLGTTAQQAESGLAAFGYGVLLGRYGEIKIGPFSADVVGGVALHGAGLLGLFGKHAGHAHNAAQGLIDGFVQRVGIGIGARSTQKTAPAKVSGASNLGSINPSYRFGAAKPEQLSVADLVTMADSAK